MHKRQIALLWTQNATLSLPIWRVLSKDKSTIVRLNVLNLVDSILEYLNSMELDAYNNCSDSVVVNMGMKEYCHTYIDPKINFWDVNVRKIII